MKHAVYCIAPSRPQAEVILSNLKSAGFMHDSISVLLPDRPGASAVAYEQNTKMPEGAATGGAVGMGAGAILGWLAGIGTLAIPGVGPFIAAGPIMAALSGAAIGSATGGVIGALVGIGIPEYEAQQYDGKVRDGKALISVHVENSIEENTIRDIFKHADAENIKSTSEQRPGGSQ